MNYETPEHHRDALARDFTEMFKAKYDRGQTEHGGQLWRKNCSSLLLEEVLDFWAYARTMEMQRNKAVAMLREVLESGYLRVDDLRGVRGAVALLEGTLLDQDRSLTADEKALEGARNIYT